MSSLQLFNQTLNNPKTQEYLQQVLSEKKSSFVNNITALVANNAKLQQCEPISLLYAGIKATALNLPLDSNLGFAYVIPYKNNKLNKVEAQFQIGYKGLIQLAIRSGQFLTINVTDVREGELKAFDLLTGKTLFDAKPNRHTLPIVGYVAYFELTNGFNKSLYMTSEVVEQHAKHYSPTYGSKNKDTANSSKWATDFDAMAKKTVLKLLLSKFAPLSVEMQNAIQSDQAVIDDKGTHYIDNATIEEVTDNEIALNANQEELSLEEAPTREAPEATAAEPEPIAVTPRKAPEAPKTLAAPF